MTDEAVGQFEAALAISDDYAQPRLYLAMIYNAKGMPDKARRHYQAAMRLSPDIAGGHGGHSIELDFNTGEAMNNYNLGLEYLNKGLADKAIENFSAAVKLLPEFPEAHYHLGVAYGSKGMIDKAIEHYERAVSISPDLAQAHNNLGNAYNVAGRTDKAIEHLSIALRLDPGNAIAHYNLGLVYLENEDPSNARSQFEAALRLKPDLHQARDFLYRIDEAAR